MAILWTQLAGSITGGIVGGFAGFVSNNIHQRILARQVRSNVACALRAEIVTLSGRIETDHLASLQASIGILVNESRYPAFSFSAQRDYSHIYKSLGQHLGLLPNEVVCELVSWYISLTIYQERAIELRDLILQKDHALLGYSIEVATRQLDDFSDLVRRSQPLVEKLRRYGR